MDQKRFLPFVMLSLAILMGWQLLIVPRFFPQPAKPQAGAQAEAKKDVAAKKDEVAAVKPADAEAEKPVPDAEKPAVERPVAELKPAKHEHKTVELGSPLDASGYRLEVTLDSRGAAVRQIELNDPHYRDLEARPAKPPEK